MHATNYKFSLPNVTMITQESRQVQQEDRLFNCHALLPAHELRNFKNSCEFLKCVSWQTTGTQHESCVPEDSSLLGYYAMSIQLPNQHGIRSPKT